MVNWQSINTLLLDMDGTLLDLYYDNHFWLEFLPQRYAETHGIEKHQAHELLVKRFSETKGTLNWYCVDFWSNELGVDIAALKYEIKHLIKIRPYVEDFLNQMQDHHPQVVLVTNAHRKSLSLKLEATGLAPLFDQIVSSHDFNKPKEDVTVWSDLQQIVPYDPASTLLIDDSLAVLRSAQSFGIQYLLTMHQPDSQQAKREIDEFPGILHFDEIMPK